MGARWNEENLFGVGIASDCEQFIILRHDKLWRNRLVLPLLDEERFRRCFLVGLLHDEMFIVRGENFVLRTDVKCAGADRFARLVDHHSNSTCEQYATYTKYKSSKYGTPLFPHTRCFSERIHKNPKTKYGPDQESYEDQCHFQISTDTLRIAFGRMPKNLISY